MNDTFFSVIALIAFSLIDVRNAINQAPCQLMISTMELRSVENEYPSRKTSRL